MPPVLTELIRCVRLRLGLIKPGLEYAPRGWKTLRKDDKSGGWAAESVAKAERAKWELFCRNSEGNGPLGFSHEHSNLSETGVVSFHNDHMSFAYVLALAAHQRDFLSVLDWGGALGHYCLIGKAVLPNVRLDFHCKEMPLLARLGKELNSSVTWYDDDSCLSRQ